MALSGRAMEAARRLEAARAGATALFSSVDGKLVQLNFALASLTLAELKAAGSQEEAERLAGEAEAAMERNRESVAAWNRATMGTRLGAVYLRLGRREKGVHCLERAASAWRSLKPPVALEERRAAELRKIVTLLGPATVHGAPK